MKIHHKALLIFFLTTFVLFAIVTALTRFVITSQFALMEDSEMQRQAERFNIDLRRETARVASAVGEWGPWDELYEYVSTRDPKFLENSLPDSALENLRLNFITIWDEQGRLVSGKVLGASEEERQKLFAALDTALETAGILPALQPGKPVSGFLFVGSSPAMIGASAITRSDRTGVVRGTVVGGEFIDQSVLEQLQKFTGLTLNVFTLDRAAATPEMLEILPAVLKSPTPVVHVLSQDRIGAYTLLRDVSGKPLMISQLTSSRDLYAQGDRSVRVFLVGLAIAGGVLFFVTWISIDRNVLTPIRNLEDRVREVAEERRLPGNLGFEGRDEISNLARGIDEMAKSLQHAEASYRAIVEDQTEFIFRYRPDGTIAFVNEAYCRYLHKERSDLLGANIYDLVAEGDRERIRGWLARICPERPVLATEHRAVTANEEVRWHNRTDRGVFSESGTLLETQCVARDITERRIAQRRLQSSEARYRRLFETSADGILLVDPKTANITDVNPTLCELLGSPREHFVGHPFREASPFGEFEAKHEALEAITNRGLVRYKEVAFANGSNGKLFVELIGTIYVAEDNKVVQINLRDITERKRADEELRALSGRLLRLQDEERRRIARELHDSTAQNLTALEMSVAQLEPFIAQPGTKAAKLLQDARELATMCCREVRTLSYLLHPPLLDEVGLTFALQWYVDGFMNRTGTVVYLDLPLELERLQPEVETTFFRIVQESLSNIHRHSGSKKAWIRLARTADEIRLEIRDEGRGIAPTRIASLQADTPAFGVGLAGMRERLRQLNGRLEVTSDRRGTTVRAIINN